MATTPKLLLINPWIYDFAAFDFWMKPLGLLYLAGYLRQHGYGVHLIDCLDRYNPDLLMRQGLSAPRMRAYGTGKFFRSSIQKPKVLKDIPYHYRRHGIPEDIFVKMLQAAPRPDAILLTSMMTYWYPAVFRAIELAKQFFPGVPVLLGGVYATLCYHHAVTNSGADYVVQERDPARIIQLIDEITEQNMPLTPFKGGICSQIPQPDSPLNVVELSPGSAGILPAQGADRMSALPGDVLKSTVLDSPLEGGRELSLQKLQSSIFDTYPAFDLYKHLDYACILTSIGCPYRCTYCASDLLCSGFFQRSPDEVFDEIRYVYKTSNIRNFAFYDDALLVNSAQHLEPLLERVIKEQLPVYFHTPNGLHARYITERLAKLMFQAGFKTLRLGLETIDRERQQRSGAKVTEKEFKRAVHILKQAGFQGNQIGVYLFIGLPEQKLQETETTIRFVHDLGVLANLSEYSPIPGTKDWKILEQQGYVSSEDDPVIHNNTVFLYMKERHTFEQIQKLKDLVRTLNKVSSG